MDEHRALKVTPDRYLTYRYAGASGDYNPIHLDDEFARSVGLPGRILHGLWTMAQVARAQTEPAGDTLALASLEVQFRGVQGNLVSRLPLEVPAPSGAYLNSAAQRHELVDFGPDARERATDDAPDCVL